MAAVVAALACVAAPLPVRGQAPATFSTQVDLVTVDVVVLDRDGRPVPGLTRDDFTIEEDGAPQSIASFEAFVAEAAPPAPAAPAVVGSNERPRSAGRAFALVVDDLGMDVAAMAGARRAIDGFLATSVRPGDEVTLATTSGDAFWSAVLPEGREDLQAVSARLRGRAAAASAAPDAMSDYEAFSIDGTGGGAADPIVTRVVKRWTDAKVCFERDPGCPRLVAARARDLEAQRRIRTRSVLLSVSRGLRALAPVRGRKSLLLFSGGFLEETGTQVRDVAAASREANVAVYFVDVRGLVGTPGLDASTNAPAAPGDVGRVSFEQNTLASEGARTLADDTGGFSVRNANDLAAGVERISAESRTFYLLGFEAPGGKRKNDWRKLRVTVKRTGLTVRARRGYSLLSTLAATGPEVAPGKPSRTLPAAVATALDSARPVEGIPMRILTYVREPLPKDLTRVVVTAEFDARLLQFADKGQERVAELEVTVAATLRDTGRTEYSDERVAVRVPRGETPGWRSLAREMSLPPGVALARVVVRDPAGARVGAVAGRFEVPKPGGLRLATPVLTDQVVRPDGDKGPPRAAMAAHRVFRPGGALYCEIEVFGAARPPGGGVPRVSAGLELRTARGGVVRRAPPTPITADGNGRVVRLAGLPLDGLEEGDYEIVLDVSDTLGGGRIQEHAPFTLVR